jgi:hypothetical protein
MPAEAAMTDDAKNENEGTREPNADDEHLVELEDGAGCAEIWEHLSKRRDGDDD